MRAILWLHDGDSEEPRRTAAFWSDVLVWRQNNIPTNSVETPEDVQLDPGTYFWSVSALREGRELADSGLSAFVVRTTP